MLLNLIWLSMYGTRCVKLKSAFCYALGGASVRSPASLLHPPEQHELHPQPQPFISESGAHNSPKSGLPQNHQPSPQQQPVKASIWHVKLKHRRTWTQQMHHHYSCMMQSIDLTKCFLRTHSSRTCVCRMDQKKKNLHFAYV